jgi:hypothetical protein
LVVSYNMLCPQPVSCNWMNRETENKHLQ